MEDIHGFIEDAYNSLYGVASYEEKMDENGNIVQDDTALRRARSKAIHFDNAEQLMRDGHSYWAIDEFQKGEQIPGRPVSKDLPFVRVLDAVHLNGEMLDNVYINDMSLGNVPESLKDECNIVCVSGSVGTQEFTIITGDNNKSFGSFYFVAPLFPEGDGLVDKAYFITDDEAITSGTEAETCIRELLQGQIPQAGQIGFDCVYEKGIPTLTRDILDAVTPGFEQEGVDCYKSRMLAQLQQTPYSKTAKYSKHTPVLGQSGFIRGLNYDGQGWPSPALEDSPVKSVECLVSDERPDGLIREVAVFDVPGCPAGVILSRTPAFNSDGQIDTRHQNVELVIPVEAPRTDIDASISEKAKAALEQSCKAISMRTTEVSDSESMDRSDSYFGTLTKNILSCKVNTMLQSIDRSDVYVDADSTLMDTAYGEAQVTFSHMTLGHVSDYSGGICTAIEFPHFQYEFDDYTRMLGSDTQMYGLLNIKNMCQDAMEAACGERGTIHSAMDEEDGKFIVDAVLDGDSNRVVSIIGQENYAQDQGRLIVCDQHNGTEDIKDFHMDGTDYVDVIHDVLRATTDAIDKSYDAPEPALKYVEPNLKVSKQQETKGNSFEL